MSDTRTLLWHPLLHFATLRDKVRLMTIFPARAVLTPKPRFSAWLAMLVMFAVLLRAALPMGFMPDLASGQKFKMVICTLYGAKTVDVDANFNPLQKTNEKKQNKHSTPCDFSINTAFTDAVSVFYHHTLSFSSSLQIIASAYKAPSAKFFFGNASSQAPPLFFYA